MRRWSAIGATGRSPSSSAGRIEPSRAPESMLALTKMVEAPFDQLHQSGFFGMKLSADRKTLHDRRDSRPLRETARATRRHWIRPRTPEVRPVL
jgi:hypothetical protein